MTNLYIVRNFFPLTKLVKDLVVFVILNAQACECSCVKKNGLRDVIKSSRDGLGSGKKIFPSREEEGREWKIYTTTRLDQVLGDFRMPLR